MKLTKSISKFIYNRIKKVKNDELREFLKIHFGFLYHQRKILETLPFTDEEKKVLRSIIDREANSFCYLLIKVRLFESTLFKKIYGKYRVLKLSLLIWLTTSNKQKAFKFITKVFRASIRAIKTGRIESEGLIKRALFRVFYKIMIKPFVNLWLLIKALKTGIKFLYKSYFWYITQNAAFWMFVYHYYTWFAGTRYLLDGAWVSIPRVPMIVRWPQIYQEFCVYAAIRLAVREELILTCLWIKRGLIIVWDQLMRYLW